MDMYNQVNVFVIGMHEEQNHLLLERTKPTTLENTFSIALREGIGTRRPKPSL